MKYAFNGSIRIFMGSVTQRINYVNFTMIRRNEKKSKEYGYQRVIGVYLAFETGHYGSPCCV